MNRSLMGTLVGLILGAACLPSPATPTPTPTPTPIPTPTPSPPLATGPEIAYVGNEGAIWVVDSESGASQSISPAGIFAQPVWSPDSEWLAYMAGGDPWRPDNVLYVVAGSGGEPRRVGQGYAAAWAPDSSRIYFMSNFIQREEPTEQTLFAAPVDTWEPQALVRRVWYSGLWPVERIVASPAGDWLAVYASGIEAEGTLLLARSDGSQVWEVGELVYTADNFDWAPDGGRLIYRDSGEPFMGGEDPSLKIIDPAHQETVLTMADGEFWPRWSPDGQHVLVFAFEGNATFTVALRTPDGAGLSRYDARAFGDIWGAHPSWSPDSSRFLFTGRIDANGDGQFDLNDPESEVLVMSRDLREPRAVARGVAPVTVWSPDGSQIAISLGESGARSLWVVNADGRGLRQIAEGDQPAWRP